VTAVASDPESSRTTAELSVIADAVDRHRERLGELARPFAATGRDDVVTTVHEAERQMLMAARALRRAMRTLEG